ncbi:MAG: aldehyde ferredoxin oxidoreductase family protein [Syntrophobacterales bacterium]|nr:MAG: aldehyde ferredoxin oxidoreductase family protein [Syntrophobacterales bacterium]
MKGDAGKIVRVNLSDGKVSKEEISEEVRKKFLGGRGFAAKILWDEVSSVDPLSDGNKIIFSTGPLTGLPLPSSGKMVIASKSPLTGGYGDGNIGSMAAVHLRRAGYDVLIVEGRSERPCYIAIQDEEVKILDARDLWGRTTFEAQDNLEAKHGRNVGILVIGPAGENMVGFANVISQRGRAAGRPGMGAVMGSKNLKAIVVKGTGKIPVFDEEELREMGKEGYREIKGKENYDFWIRQGTMLVFEWCNENSCLPTNNFREGTFRFSKRLDGYALEKAKVDRKGCPLCNMQCGNIINDAENKNSELDYENVGMLGPNIGMDDLRKVGVLNRMADELGLDTISLGSCLGFLMEASEKGLIDAGIAWGDLDGCKEVIEHTVKKKGLGEIIFEGVRRASERVASGSEDWAMHVKGLEISAYDCHACPGMALSYGTSPIGAHHKDAWVISWEISTDRFSHSKEKVEKVVELQRLRGGLFESMTTCRLPWVEVDFGLHWYPKYLQAVRGQEISQEEIFKLGDRIYALIRSYWIRENRSWSREMDYPPSRWFEEALSQGDLRGYKLDRARYDEMLSMYYEIRGWDENGIPQKETLEGLGLGDVELVLGKND